MKIHFMDMKTGTVYAKASAVKVESGKLVPDSMGLPVIEGDNCDDCEIPHGELHDFLDFEQDTILHLCEVCWKRRRGLP